MMNMCLEDMEKELAESRWKPKPEDDQPVTEEELPAGIEEEAKKKKAALSKGGLNPAAVGVSGPYGTFQLSQHLTAQIGAI